jgi:hypothetical protein
MAKMAWTNWRGKDESRELNWTLDIRDHRGEPGFALLAIAANTHLSVADLMRLLAIEGVKRSRSWIQRRRWLFQQPDTVNSPGKPNADGKDARAVALMADNPTLSVRQLVRLLSKAGIARSREWVRTHRCDRVTDNTPPI